MERAKPTSWRLFRLALLNLILSAGLIGCASPTSPSSERAGDKTTPPTGAAQPVTLTVRVLTRTSEQPIQDAFVGVNPAASARTDASGICTFSVQSGSLADVDVSARGFLPLGASGVLMNDERWTFYLEAAATN